MKKNLFCIIAVLSLLWLFAPVPASALVDIEEHFDGITSGVPDEWDNLKGTTTVTTLRWNYNVAGHEGGGLVFNSSSANNVGGKGGTNILLSPAFSRSGREMQLSFWYKNPNGGDFTVCLTADNGTTFMDTLATGLKADEWTLTTYLLPVKADAATVRIAFCSTGNLGQGDAFHYLDNVIIEDRPTCPTPINLGISHLKSAQAMLTWDLSTDADAVPATYTLKLAKDGLLFRTDDAIVSSDFSYLITGLDPATSYSATLSSDCGDNGTSKESYPVTFRTPALPVDLTYEQNFGKPAETTALPSDWLIEGNATLVSNAGRENTVKATAKTAAVRLVTPPVNHPANDIQFTIWAYGLKGMKFQIGLVSDPSSPTFEPLITDAEIAQNWAWQEFRVSTKASYGSAAKNMMFVVYVPQGSAQEIYFDDVNIRTSPTCPRPEQLTVTDVTDTHATITWEGNEKPVKREVELVASETTVREMTENPFTVDNLTPNTEYTVRVRDICAVGDISDWSAPITFTTDCSVLTDPIFVQDFENASYIPVMPACWQSRIIEAGTGSGVDYGDNVWQVSQTYKQSGMFSAQLRNAAKGTRALLVSQPVIIDAAGKYTASFSTYRIMIFGTEYSKVRILFNNKPDTVGAQKCDFIPSAYNQSPVEAQANKWYTYEYPVEKTGVVYIMVEGVVGDGMGCYVDDIEVKLTPSCPKIKGGFVFSDTTDTSVRMKWTPGTDETEWLVDYKLIPVSGTPVEKTDVPVYGTPEIVFGEMASNTQYTVQGTVRAKCAADDIAEAVSFSQYVKTKCSAVSVFPYTESFDNAVTPACWLQSQTVKGSGTTGSDWTYGAWQKTTSPKFKGSAAAQMKVSKAGGHYILVSQQMDFAAPAAYRLSLHVNRISTNDEQAAVKVWVNSTPDTIGGKRLLNIKRFYGAEPAETTYGWHKYNADIPVNGRQYIIIEGIAGNSYTMEVDELFVEQIPECEHLDEFSADSVAADAIRVVVDASVQQFEVEYGAPDFEHGNGTIVLSNGASCIIKGLAPETEYDVYVRRVCGDKRGRWSETAQNVKTRCAAFAVDAGNEFFEDFETHTSGTRISDCFSYLHVNTGAKADYWAKQHYNFQYNPDPNTGGKLYAQYLRQNAESWVFYPLKLNGGKAYEISLTAITNSTYLTNTEVSLGYTSDFKTVHPTTVNGANLGDKWTPFSTFIEIEADGTYYVGWKIKSSNYMSGIDNFRVCEVACVPPLSAEVRDIRTNTASLRWTSTAAEWEVLVTTQDCAPDDVTEAAFRKTGIAEKSVQVDNLAENTKYYYWIRSVCGETPSVWSERGSFVTACPAVTEVLSDAESDVAEEMSCWTIVPGGTLMRSGYYSHSGTYSFAMQNKTVVSPEMAADDLKGYMITGWAYAMKDNAAFTVGVAGAPDKVETWSDLQEVVIASKNRLTEFTVYLSVLEGEEASYRYITIATGADNIYFDDVKIMPVPSCPKPTDAVFSDITPDGCTLAWSTIGKEKEWEIRVLDGNNTVKTEVVKTNPTKITGLAPVTTYSVQLRAVCAVGDTSELTDCGTFTTACGALAIPYRTEFRNLSADVFPICWERGESNTEDANNAWKGNYSNMYYQPYKTDCSAIIKTAEYDLTNEYGARADFSVQFNNNGSVELLLSTDGGATFPNSLGTFTSANSSRQDLSADISEYAGNKVVMAFKGITGSNQYASVNLSALYIERIEKCPRPTKIEFKASTENSVTVALTDTVDAHTAWQLTYGAVGLDPDKSPVVDCGDKTACLVPDLDAATDYEVYARSVCGTDEHSLWQGPVSVRTACPAANTVPYTESFELKVVADGCFKLYNERTNNGTPWGQINTQPQNISDGKCGLYMQTSKSEPLFICMPKFDTPTNKLRLSFDYNSYGQEIVSVGVMTDPTDKTSFVEVEMLPAANAMTRASVLLNRLDNRYADAVVTVKFGPDGLGYRYGAVDNVLVEQVITCPDMQNFEVAEIELNSVTLSAMSNTEEIDVVYGTKGTAVEDCLPVAGVKPGMVKIDGLTEATAYVVYARTHCETGEGLGSWTDALEFITACSTKTVDNGVDFTDNFDSYTTYLPCYTTVSAYAEDGTVYPAVMDANAVSEPATLAFKGNSAIALPNFTTPAHYLKVSFAASGEGKMVVGLQNSLDADVGMFVADTVDVALDYDTYEIDLSSVAVRAEYIVLRSITGSGINVDDLKVSLAPTCFAPRAVELLEFTDTSARVCFLPSLGSTEFELKAVATDGEVTAVAANDTAGIGGLKGLTQYSLSVRAKCGSGYTDWSEAVVFTTLPAPAVLDYACNFEEKTEYDSWYILNSPSSSNRFIIADKAGDDVHNNTLYVGQAADSTYSYQNGAQAATIFAYRKFELERGTYNIGFDWLCEGLIADGVGVVDFGRVFLVHDSVGIEANASDFYGATLPDNCCLVGDNRLAGKKDWQTAGAMLKIRDAGRYNLVFMWNCQSYYPNGGQKKPLAIDNVKFDRILGLPLEQFSLNAVSTDTAAISFVNKNEPLTVEYYLTPGSKPEEAKKAEVENIVLKDLTPATGYTLNIRPVVSVEMPWLTFEFSTRCTPDIVTAGNSFADDFETYAADEEIVNCWLRHDADYGCWSVKSDAANAHSDTKYVTVKTDNRAFSLIRDFKLEANTYYDISVWAKAGNVNERTTLDIVERRDNKNVTLSAASLSKEYTEYTHELYILKDTIYQLGVTVKTNTIGDDVFVDYFTLAVNPLGTPRELRIVAAETNTADFVWLGNAPYYEYEVLGFNGEAVKYGKIQTTSAHIEGLAAATAYTFRICSVVDGKRSAWTSIDFNTACGVVDAPFFNDFERVADSSVPQCWDNTTGCNLPVAGHGWVVRSDRQNKLLYLDAKDAPEGKARLSTPQIALPVSGSYISFDYNVSNAEYSLDVLLSLDGGTTVADTLLSSGATMNEVHFVNRLDTAYAGKNVTIVFNVDYDKPATAGRLQHISVDNVIIKCLAADNVTADTICPNTENDYISEDGNFKFLAKDIRVHGDYLQSKLVKSQSLYDCDHLDVFKLHVSESRDVVIDTTICKGETYYCTEYPDAFPDGLNSTCTKFADIATDDGCPAKLTIRLTVADPRKEIVDTICQGGVYPFGDRNLTETDIYFDTIPAATGCDTVVTLNLTVLPDKFEQSMSVCEKNTPYEWHGQMLDTTGRYEFRSKYAGRDCDSIAILHFTVLPDTTYINTTVCQGRSVFFAGRDCDTTGVYLDRRENVLKCDSIIKLTLTVIPAETKTINTHCCEGRPFSGYGYSDISISSDTVLLRTVHQAGQCDYIQRLEVKLMARDTTFLRDTIKEGEVYPFGGSDCTEQKRYQYRDFNQYGCDSIVILDLVVLPKTGVDVVATYRQLELTPNPLRSGQTLTVGVGLTDNVLEEAFVEVINATGQLVLRRSVDNTPVTVHYSEFGAPGVYFVRITMPDSQRYVGKVLVE